MAYLIGCQQTCSERYCYSRATVELKDWRNESRGKFCRKHGNAALRDREKFEKEHANNERLRSGR